MVNEPLPDAEGGEADPALTQMLAGALGEAGMDVDDDDAGAHLAPPSHAEAFSCRGHTTIWTRRVSQSQQDDIQAIEITKIISQPSDTAQVGFSMVCTFCIR